jgi:hypothetical protein
LLLVGSRQVGPADPTRGANVVGPIARYRNDETDAQAQAPVAGIPVTVLDRDRDGPPAAMDHASRRLVQSTDSLHGAASVRGAATSLLVGGRWLRRAFDGPGLIRSEQNAFRLLHGAAPPKFLRVLERETFGRIFPKLETDHILDRPA